MKYRHLFCICFLFTLLCTPAQAAKNAVVLGAEREDVYLPILQDKRIALFSNHTGVAGGEHTLDRLIRHGMNVVAIFSPEHGFRGTAGAGDRVSDSVDPKTGISILSLYDGKRQQPSDETMMLFDVLVVDIQDVGLRYYTYYISMLHLMNACANAGREVVVLDRPNPNGHYVDGPILDMRYRSGVGAIPIPIVHGMTLGELAQMINGERWLRHRQRCQLTVVPCLNYTHHTEYRLPIAPSPNLRNMTAIYLYPSMCYFEATPVSLGRGTAKPFLQYGHPKMHRHKMDKNTHRTTFRPKACTAAPHPTQEGKRCRGVNLSRMPEAAAREKQIDLRYLIDAYNALGEPDSVFLSPFFEKLIGVGYVRTMIREGKSAEEIRAKWRYDVLGFKELRRPYLLYEE